MDLPSLLSINRLKWGPRSLDDLHEVLEIIQSRHPNVPIVGAGFSFGGLCLQSYAGSPANHKSKLLKAAVSFSGCFDPEFIYTEGVLRHRLMPYDLGLSLSVVNDMKPHFELMGKHLGTDLGKVLIGSRSMEAYHNAITIQAMGISSTVEYWLMMGQFHRQLMRSINVPVLSLLADDDPLIPPKVSAGAVESITQSDGAILVQTKRGGHAGFFEYSTGECYADRVALDFLNACCRRCVV
ncbi:hypothetical protein SARC_13009 [Sphaeroforma arctica JP610]|uniref:Serine aminopeptidase S33 domain-containing protein n=1 Tax=Sphaeroforma arctica JP610 TaxID=667725 RepID=A0A0L0FCD9_9EUKA|nr:hypothetical protein SARC_13009 [Sphaeroforma arctica JP610]KNC74442.1 hypothetical protein SARC_13009 [Sphaeroforma arctica JP610]|eukprot:XP_014148344.1 hypothetical protein SARC_13009 [Sphaeroforma arctica JP610]